MDKKKATIEETLGIALAVGNSLQLGEMLTETVEAMVRLTGADSGIAWLKTGTAKKYYTPVAFAGKIKRKEVITTTLPPDNITCTLTSKEAILIDESHPRFKQFQYSHPTKSIIIIPFNKSGLICLASKETFDPDWCKMLSGIIPRLSKAVELCRQHRKTAEKAVKVSSKSESRYQEILDNIPDIVYTIDEKGRYSYLNKACAAVTGYSRDEMLGKHFSIVVHPEDMRANLEFFKQMKSICDVELRLLTKTGQVIYTEIHAKATLNKKGRILRTDAVCRDITWRRQLEEELIRRHQELSDLHDQVKMLSIRDALTGLYNRHYFSEQLKKLYHPQYQPVSVIMMDIDGLKVVNDTLGHAQGDALLKAAAEVIKSSVRVSDIVARIGGDEFAVILPQTDEEKALEVCRRINEVVQQYNQQVSPSGLSISVGLATSQREHPCLSETLKKADDEMYKDKSTRGAVAKLQLISRLNSHTAI
jgi:diguanylate cyclase (GGDEF)-like protein/PAS domain S-box-containing protein